MDFRRPFQVVTPTLDGDVLAVLAGAQEEFTGRGIQRVLARGSEPGIRKAADRLVDQGVVLRRRAGQANLYSLNRDHLAAPYVEGLAALRAELVGRLRAGIAKWKTPARWVLLFGSVARGEADPESDLDLLVIRDRRVDEGATVWREQVASLESDAAAWTGNEARVLEYGVEDLRDRSVSIVVAEALRDGIDLHGSRRELLTALRKAGG